MKSSDMPLATSPHFSQRHFRFLPSLSLRFLLRAFQPASHAASHFSLSSAWVLLSYVLFFMFYRGASHALLLLLSFFDKLFLQLSFPAFTSFFLSLSFLMIVLLLQAFFPSWFSPSILQSFTSSIDAELDIRVFQIACFLLLKRACCQIYW